MRGLLFVLIITVSAVLACESVNDCYHLLTPGTVPRCHMGICLTSPSDDCSFSDDKDEISHMKELTKDTFKDTIAEGVWFVDFSAPWCGWCKKLNPIWDNLHRLVEDRWNVAKVDCKEEMPYCQEQFNVTGFPTLKLFKDGAEVAEWDGGPERTFWSMIRWVEAKLPDDVETTCVPSFLTPEPELAVSDTPSEDRDGSIVILSDENIGATVREGYWFVKFYAPWCGHCKRMADEWRSLAEDNPLYNIAEVDCTVHKESSNTYGVRGYPTIILLKDGIEHAKYSGDRTSEAFVTFMRDNTHEHDEL